LLESCTGAKRKRELPLPHCDEKKEKKGVGGGKNRQGRV